MPNGTAMATSTTAITPANRLLRKTIFFSLFQATPFFPPRAEGVLSVMTIFHQLTVSDKGRTLPASCLPNCKLRIGLVQDGNAVPVYCDVPPLLSPALCPQCFD